MHTLTQRVHLQLLPQTDLLQAVVEVGLWGAGGRQSEDAHDLPLVSARCTGMETEMRNKNTND